QIADDIDVDGPIGTEPRLGLQKQDTDLIAHRALRPQRSPLRSSCASRSLARAASVMAVSTGFFSGPVVNAEESATTTLRTACSRPQASSMPNFCEACIRHVPA